MGNISSVRERLGASFTGSTISNLKADFSNQVEQSIQTVGKCRWITFGKSQGHGEPHEH
jgi:hypothetical protein